MTNVIYPLRFRQRGPAIRAVHPVDDEELQAAAALLNLAVTRPEKRAEIVAKVADYLAGERSIL